MAISWAKKGNAAQQAIKDEEARKKKEAEERGKMWRFFLKDGESAKITFIDGGVTDEGHLDALMYREHMVNVNGKWTNFVCVADDEPCPLCESGDSPSLVAALTIIDHRVVKGSKATYQDSPRLYIFKQSTFKVLQKLAVKRGGLAGCRFEVSRTGEKEPAVGDMFDFEEKTTDLKSLEALYQQEYEDNGVKKHKTKFVAADYEHELPYHSAASLREMGFGNSKLSHSTASTKKSASPEAGSDESSSELEDHL